MDLKKIFNKQSFGIVIGLLGTGIGAYGGMPTPPQTFIKLVNKYKFLQWFLVYVLIWQGAGGYDEKISFMGTIIIYAIYKLIRHAERWWDLRYKLGLDKYTRKQRVAIKAAKKAAKKAEAEEEESGGELTIEEERAERKKGSFGKSVESQLEKAEEQEEKDQKTRDSSLFGKIFI